jgi:thiosulfate/3-mercaptopyruvate sulfurtransferase
VSALGGPLISVVQLAHSREDVTVLDIRWELGGRPGREMYDEGHIPGAVFVDLDAVLAAPPGPGGRHPMPDASQFGRGMRAAGVCNERPVVVYDAATSMAAARAWWLLRYFGHRAVAVLDGGLAAWVKAGQPVSRELPRVRTGDFQPRPSGGGMPMLDAAAAQRTAAHGVLIDARAPERFKGESEPIDPVAGHIPGARNRPSAENVHPDGRFKGPETLRRAFAELGIDSGTAVGAYCGSGVVAAHEVLALELAGHPAALYVGSWSDWITDPARPVATGAG